MKVSKNSNKLTKKYQTHKKPKRPIWRLARGTLSHFSTSIVAKHQKIEGGPFGEKKIPKKSLTMPKKLEDGPFRIFQHPFCHKTSKIEGGPLGQMIHFGP